MWYQSRVSHDDTLPGDGAVVPTNATVVTGSIIDPLVVSRSKDGNAVVPNVPVNKMLVSVQNF